MFDQSLIKQPMNSCVSAMTPSNIPTRNEPKYQAKTMFKSTKTTKSPWRKNYEINLSNCRPWSGMYYQSGLDHLDMTIKAEGKYNL